MLIPNLYTLSTFTAIKHDQVHVCYCNVLQILLKDLPIQYQRFSIANYTQMIKLIVDSTYVGVPAFHQIRLHGYGKYACLVFAAFASLCLTMIIKESATLSLFLP